MERVGGREIKREARQWERKRQSYWVREGKKAIYRGNSEKQKKRIEEKERK